MVDHASLGFKAGLEIHQQIGSYKLFCRCPTLNSDAKQDVSFKRRLRAVAGESGDIDIAAKHEMEKGKEFWYVGDSDDTCLVEYDESPPNPIINKEALNTALQVSLLLNAKIVDEIQVMRKTVVDGSNVSGFQRTSLIAYDGHFETSKGIVKIPTICIEEEACQKLENTDHYVKYKLDRLGIPLIEIATDATLKDGEHAKEAAAYIGMVLRSVSGVKRGLGTIRQDVNVSIAKGARTEIKGFQDLKSIPKVIENEIGRQQAEIKKGKKLEKEVRKAEPDFTTSFLRPMPGAARLYPETDVLPFAVDASLVAQIKKNLPKLLDEQIGELAKKYSLSKELAKEALENDHFQKLVSTFKKIEPSVIAAAIITTPKEIKTRLKLDPGALSYHDFEQTLSYLEEGKISKEAIIDILAKKIKKEKIDLSEFESASEDDVEAEIKKIIREKPGLNQGAYMGLVMQKFRGKIEGKKIMELLKKLVP